MSSFWTSRCVTVELFILSMIFCLTFVLAVSVTGHSRMKCFRFSIPFPHVGSTVYWLNLIYLLVRCMSPVSILAFIAAFSMSFGLFLTVFHTGWHTPIWSWLTDIMARLDFDDLSSTILLHQNLSTLLSTIFLKCSFFIGCSRSCRASGRSSLLNQFYITLF